MAVAARIPKTFFFLALLTLVCGGIGLAAPQPADASATVIFLTSGTSWTVPSDWNNSSNTVEAIGGRR